MHYSDDIEVSHFFILYLTVHQYEVHLIRHLVFALDGNHVAFGNCICTCVFGASARRARATRKRFCFANGPAKGGSRAPCSRRRTAATASCRTSTSNGDNPSGICNINIDRLTEIPERVIQKNERRTLFCYHLSSIHHIDPLTV